MRVLLSLVLALACSACALSHELPGEDSPPPPPGRDGGGETDASLEVDDPIDGQPDVTPDVAPDVAADVAADVPADTAEDTPPGMCMPVAPVACDGVDDDCDGDFEEGMCTGPTGNRRGLYFEADDFVEITGTGLEIGESPFTLELWFEPDASSPPGAIFGNRATDDGTVPGVVAALGLMSPLAPQIALTRTTVTASGVDLSGPTYLAVARDGTGELYYAFNDRRVRPSRTHPDSVGGGPFRIGVPASRGSSFTGIVSRIRLWSVARPDETLVRNSVDATDTTGLLAEFNFSEGSGQTITSLVGDATGRLGSTPADDDADPTWVTD